MENLEKRPLPRLLIDARMVGQVPHGFSRYVERMAEGLRERGPLPYSAVFIVTEEFPHADFKGFELVRAKSPFLAGAELAELPWILLRERASLYHSPSFSSLVAAPCPWVVTVHDLNHLSFGDSRRKLYYRLLLRRFIRQAKKLITVSSFSARELADWLQCDVEAIALVFNSLEKDFLTDPGEAEVDRILATHGLSRGGYFFCLSNSKPHKNLARLFEAYTDYRAKAVPGSAPWPLALNLNLPRAAEGVRSLGPLKDEEVRALLAGAGAAVFPSLYEGFGLPPVEAAAMGAPLIVSRIPAHQEGLADLGSEEAVWVDAEDIPGWTHAMLQASRGSLRPASAASRALLRQRFSSARMGQDMDRIYRDVLGLK